MAQPSRGNIRMSYEGTWDPSSLEAAMADFGLFLSKSNGSVARWAKPAGTTERYPLVVDTKVDEERHAVLLRGYVLSDDGKAKLTLDGDDGVSHHAKSGALDDFENVCDRLRDNLRKRDDGQGEQEDDGFTDVAPTEVAEVATPVQQPVATQEAGYGWQQPTQPQQQYPASQQWQGAPVAQQMVQTPAPYQYGASQQMQQVPLATVPQQAPQQATPQFGYGATELPQQRTQQGVAPGWAVQSVPNKCWMFIAISCVELLLLMAESMYISYAISFLITVPFLSWPAIPAIVYSVAYKNAFQAGNAQLALAKMRLAKGWIIGAGVWCVVRVLLKLTLCSDYY